MMQLMVVRQGSKIQKLRELGRFTLGLMEEHGGSRMGRRELGVSRHETEGVWRFQAGTEESQLLHVVQEAEFGGSRQRRKDLAGCDTLGARYSAASGLDRGSSATLCCDRKK